MDNPAVEEFNLSYYCPISAESGLATLHFPSQKVGLLLGRITIISLQFGTISCWFDVYYLILRHVKHFFKNKIRNATFI